ncbi:hypothetical protein T261_7845 [Streptomyces lydicus]|nr:hypothetical protein T261_7845 [Streptomyces lydicus]
MLDELAVIGLRLQVLAGMPGAQRTPTSAAAWAAMSSYFVRLRVCLAGRRPKPAANGTIPLVWLIVQWLEGEDEPVKYWISKLPAGLPAKRLLRLAKSPGRSSTTVGNEDRLGPGGPEPPPTPPGHVDRQRPRPPAAHPVAAPRPKTDDLPEDF